MSKSSRKISVLLALIISGALTLSACGSVGLGKADPTATAEPVQASSSSSKQVIAEGRVGPKDSRYLSFGAPGHVAEVLVKKGDSVTEGQVLARLEKSEEATARLDAASVEIAAAQQALDDLERTAGLTHNQAWVALVKANQALVDAQKAWDTLDTQKTTDDIESAQTEVADAQKALNTAKDDFEPYKNLPQDNSQRKSAQQTLDDAEKTYSDAVAKRDTLQNALDLAKASLDQAITAQAEAKHHFDQTQDRVDPSQLTLAQLRLQAAEAQASAAQSALNELELKAPFGGTVMDVNLLANELVNPNTLAVLLADTSEWLVRTTDLTELDVVKIEEGQEVNIVPDALSDLNLKGTVQEISKTFTTKTGDILYEVKIKLDETDPRLRWGMTVEARFAEK
jgi:multidrug efflux pump subunit AcrA (membrane-fusion protein)